MYKFFVDTVDVPEEIGMNVPNYRPFSPQTFIGAAKKYVENEASGQAFYYIEDPLNVEKVRYFKEEPINGYSSFVFGVALQSQSLFLAIEESIQLAGVLQVNCFELLEETTPICYMYRMREWFPIIENSSYCDIVTTYLRNK
ncbi:hypothetical protein SFC81_00325 [Enterococcus faecalis]